MRGLRTAVDLRAFRGILPIAVLLAFFLLTSDLLVLAWKGPAPAERVTDDWHVIPWKDLEHADGQVASLESALGDSRKPFVVYVGGSTANQGIDPAVLQRFGSCHTPVMGLCTIGTGMSRMREIAEPLLRRHLHPSVALLGVHSLSLAGSYSQEPPQSINPIAPLAHGDWHESARRLRWLNWFSMNQAYTEHVALSGFVNMRGWMNLSSKIPPATPPDLHLPEHEPPTYLEVQMDGFRLHGCFDPRRYLLHRDEELRALEELVSRFQDLGTKVILVIMPETTTLRALVPAEEEQFMTDSISKRFGNVSPAILNYRDAMRDEMFTDYAHLNSVGRAKLSLQLAQALRNRQPDTTCSPD